MGFAVAHEAGTKDGEYQAYIRLLSRRLLKSDVDLEYVPRIRDKATENSWLYVWENKGDAEAFADELKKQTGDSGWVIRPVREEPSLGPLRPLQINVGRQSDGWVFGLEPLTRKAIETKFPGSCRRNRVFIGWDTRGDFQATQGDLRDLAEQVLIILTGLRSEQLRTFESVWVVDPVTGTELVPPFHIE